MRYYMEDLARLECDQVIDDAAVALTTGALQAPDDDARIGKAEALRRAMSARSASLSACVLKVGAQSVPARRQKLP